jgi:hypothetical protein
LLTAHQCDSHALHEDAHFDHLHRLKHKYGFVNQCSQPEVRAAARIPASQP